MSDLRDLYQEVILDHGKRPRNHGALSDANCSAEGRNPLCGDHLHVFVKTDNGIVVAVRFEGSGCAISVASASMMTQAIVGKPIEEAQRISGLFHGMVAGEPEETTDTSELGKLIVFGGVREFPMRVKCATLPWHTLRAALDHEKKPASTE
jgi:nitrogen fixation NifU-like protein